MLHPAACNKDTAPQAPAGARRGVAAPPLKTESPATFHWADRVMHKGPRFPLWVLRSRATRRPETCAIQSCGRRDQAAMRLATHFRPSMAASGKRPCSRPRPAAIRSRADDITGIDLGGCDCQVKFRGVVGVDAIKRLAFLD